MKQYNRSADIYHFIRYRLSIHVIFTRQSMAEDMIVRIPSFEHGRKRWSRHASISTDWATHAVIVICCTIREYRKRGSRRREENERCQSLTRMPRREICKDAMATSWKYSLPKNNADYRKKFVVLCECICSKYRWQQNRNECRARSPQQSACFIKVIMLPMLCPRA